MLQKPKAFLFALLTVSLQHAHGQNATAIDQGKSKNIAPRHALVVNPYNVAVQFSVEQAAVGPRSVIVKSDAKEEFLCVNCTVSLVTEKDDGSLVEVKHTLIEGRRYRVVWTSDRYELREVAAR